MADPETDEEGQLTAMRDRACAELEDLDTAESLEDWRTRYLGRERGDDAIAGCAMQVQAYMYIMF